MTSATLDPVLDPVLGNELLEHLGFLHVPGRPAVEGQAYLLVAMRPHPTLRHFDPERVDYWTTVDGRGKRTVLDRSEPAPESGSYAWGVISVVDRKVITNDFVSFGGHLSVRRIDEVRVAVFSSEAPIAARGGHSQGWDPAADEMAAFIARLRAAAGTDHGLEVRLAAESPTALYASFVADSLRRHHDGRGTLVGDARGLELLEHERHRLLEEEAAEWEAGTELASRLR